MVTCYLVAVVTGDQAVPRLWFHVKPHLLSLIYCNNNLGPLIKILPSHILITDKRAAWLAHWNITNDECINWNHVAIKNKASLVITFPSWFTSNWSHLDVVYPELIAAKWPAPDFRTVKWKRSKFPTHTRNTQNTKLLDIYMLQWDFHQILEQQ